MSLPVGGLQDSQAGWRPAHRRRNVWSRIHERTKISQEASQNRGRKSYIGQSAEFQEVPSRNYSGSPWKSIGARHRRPCGRRPRMG
eukprot:16101354-Heterocapsa_arctica.AAC.1